MKTRIPFNSWSREKIESGKKSCTSRHKCYNEDPRVNCIIHTNFKTILQRFWCSEGAASPEELRKVFHEIYGREIPDNEMFYVHFGDFKETNVKKLTVIT